MALRKGRVACEPLTTELSRGGLAGKGNLSKAPRAPDANDTLLGAKFE
jgi:hypothetical protein